jgi:hypothetical protein
MLQQIFREVSHSALMLSFCVRYIPVHICIVCSKVPLLESSHQSSGYMHYGVVSVVTTGRVRRAHAVA